MLSIVNGGCQALNYKLEHALIVYHNFDDLSRVASPSCLPYLIMVVKSYPTNGH